MSGHWLLSGQCPDHSSIARRARVVVATHSLRVWPLTANACSRVMPWEQISELQWPLKTARGKPKERRHPHPSAHRVSGGIARIRIQPRATGRHAWLLTPENLR